MAPAWDVSPEGLARDTDVEAYRSGGPGGQHKNKTETAIRLVHRPSGVRVVSTDSRSRLQNLATAFERLAEKLRVLMIVKKPRKATKPGKGAERRRLQAKTHRKTIKATRRAPGDD